MKKKNINFTEEIKNSENFLHKVWSALNLVGEYQKDLKGYEGKKQINLPSEYLGQIIQVPLKIVKRFRELN